MVFLVGLNDILLSPFFFPRGTNNFLLSFILTFPRSEVETYLKFMGNTFQETMNISFYITVSVRLQI